ncbi:Hsp70 family protein [Actinoplanes italicus]|uniref:Uncharacterized protein n=1 Tax=Actinoplanes italicus TaxID=113567 RepID=A0A2T0K5J3_9ACTN|nr:hypothetical protein [Actinoplanes italicus]PRX18220.1 hypothetical protein CLV67_11353 [Actinoplanes italicus]
MLRLSRIPGSAGSPHLLTITGEDPPASWIVEVRRAGGESIRTRWDRTRLCLDEPVHTGELLRIIVLQPQPGGARLRYPVRILVPEVTMTDATLRVQAIPVLDFGTHGQCAALWDNNRRLPRGQLSDSQITAVAEVIGMDPGTQPEDVEVRAAHAWTGEDVDVADLRSRAWDEVFGNPPLEHYAIREVIQPRTLALGNDRLGSRGLKRDLLKHSHDEKALESLVEAYREMGEEALGSLTNDFGDRLLPYEIQFTYPTRLPAAQRVRLQRLLEATGLPKPRLYLDEATAVAFFDLLTRIGQRNVLGLAALQARAQGNGHATGLSDRVLVIDVGAGTTDVALIDMRIVDATPDAARTVAGHGHFWILAPYVQAAGGHLNYGADRLTLDFFKVIKERLRERGTEVATDWRSDDSRWADFLVLWQVAEETKHRALGPSAGQDLDVVVPLSSGTVVVPLRWRADMAPHAESFLRRLAKLAAGIAKAGLESAAEQSSPDTAPRVDRVVLSGTSFRSPYLRDRLEQVLLAVFKEENGLNHDFDLTTHRNHLKSAAALGAAFAASIRDNESHPEHLDVIADLRAGVHKFGVRSADLRTNLAAEFRTAMGGMASGTTTIFAHGIQLSRYAPVSGAEGNGAETRRFARSIGHAVWPTITIERRDAADVRTSLAGTDHRGSDSHIAWGTFRIEGLDELSRSRPDLDDAHRRTSAAYEIDENENVTMYLYLDEAPPLDLRDGNPVGELPAGSVGDGRLTADVHLNAGNQLQDLGTPLLAAGSPLPAVVSVSAARERASLSVFTGASDRPTVLTVQHGHTWVSVDGDGVVRSHLFEPPILADEHDGTTEATTRFLEQALPDRAGERHRASRFAIQPAGQYDEQSDPFSGVH